MDNMASFLTPELLPMIMIPAVSKIGKLLKSGTMLGLMMDNYLQENVSDSCKYAFSYLELGLNEGSTTALKFLDATGKILPGMAQGTFYLPGSFDQCLGIDYPNREEALFRGKYCNVNIDTGGKLGSMMGVKKKVPFRFDMCIPDACNENDIDVALNNITQYPLNLLPEFGITIKTVVCQTREFDPLSTGQTSAIAIFAVLGSLLLIGTLVDLTLRLRSYFSNDNNGRKSKDKVSVVGQILMSFSLYTNALKIFNTNTIPDNLPAVHGVRFLSMSWILLGHSYMMVPLYGNFLELAKRKRGEIAAQAVLNAHVAVDSFFFLSGLLVAYVILKNIKNGGKISWSTYYFHRIWRLTPAYAAVILFTQIFPLIGSGSLWKETSEIIMKSCENVWWTMLLYIYNFYVEPMDTIACIGQSWYLAVDTQFYVVSPIILLPLIKKPKLGLIVNSIFLLASIVTPAVLGTIYHYIPTTLVIEDDEKLIAYTNDINSKPYCRMGPFCVGIFVGYFLSTTKQLNLSKLTKAVIWCVAIASNMSVLFGVAEWNNGYKSSNAVNTLYMATHRTVWALGVAWMVVCCSTGNGGFVNAFLSWKLFVPLSRLSYLAFLIHGLIHFAYVGMLRVRPVFTDYTHVVMFLGLLVATYGFACVASLAVEAPFIRLEKIIFSRSEKPTKEHENGSATNPDALILTKL